MQNEHEDGNPVPGGNADQFENKSIVQYYTTKISHIIMLLLYMYQKILNHHFCLFWKSSDYR